MIDERIKGRKIEDITHAWVGNMLTEEDNLHINQAPTYRDKEYCRLDNILSEGDREELRTNIYKLISRCILDEYKIPSQTVADIQEGVDSFYVRLHRKKPILSQIQFYYELWRSQLSANVEYQQYLKLKEKFE